MSLSMDAPDLRPLIAALLRVMAANPVHLVVDCHDR
jgi:hypothetical protein